MYLVDANVFIEAANKYYALEVVPGFWRWMSEAGVRGEVASVIAVRDELEAPPELLDWVRDDRRRSLFRDESDPAIQAAYQRVSRWVMEGDFGAAYQSDFLAGADAWLVAAAVEYKAVVVTHENWIDPRSGSPKVKIPNVCDAFELEYVTTFQMLEECNAVLT